MKKALYKVPNGKLLKIFLEEKNGEIVSLKITGDFFFYPEENMEKLEESLIDCELSADPIRLRIEDFLRKNPTTFFGIDTQSLISTILQCQ